MSPEALLLSLLLCPQSNFSLFPISKSYLLTQRLKLVRINILPNPLHIIPVRDNAMLEWIPDLEQTPQFLRPVADEDVAFQTACEDARVFGPADEGGEEAFGQVFAGVACADGAAAVVDYDGRVVEVGHGLRWV